MDQKHNICEVCGWWKRICHCRDLELFNTTKDRLYEFTDYKTFGKPVEVHGKGHWKKLLKERGLTDDFEQKPKTEEQLRKQGQFFNKYETVDRKFISNQILSELKEKNLYHKLVKGRR